MKNIMRTYAMESGKEGVCTYLHRKKHTNNATLDKNKRYALTFEGISHPLSLTLKRPVHCRFEIRVRAVRDKNQFCIGKENIIMITYSVILAYTSLATSITSPSA